MKMKGKNFSIALSQLKYEKVRLLVALSGIIFAVVMMFMQLGFSDALFDSSVLLHKSMQADVFLLHSKSSALVALKSFSKYYLYQLLEFPEVKSVSPIHLGYANWKNPWNNDNRSIFVLGIDPSNNVLDLPGIQENLTNITYPDGVLFDMSSRPEFGAVVTSFNAGETILSELQGSLLKVEKVVKVVGLFRLGASFAANGHLLTSNSNFVNILTNKSAASIEIGTIQLNPNANLKQSISEIRSRLPSDVLAFTKDEFINFEKDYWKRNTAVGFIFSLSTMMAFIVGSVIVYQVLYTDVSEHLPGYAILKAMGYTDISLLWIIIQESLILSILGYIPGFLIAMISYQQTKSATLLPIGMTVDRGITLLLVTILMCLISGLIAVRKLRDADPADIF
ncbi:ABC transporter permease DevC [Anabaena sp. WA102]|uniref:ABC transporter permease DevC n=1 Tax=Anabaena sp. WA102 TaxID=1647413 RepID=UPI000ABE778D